VTHLRKVMLEELQRRNFSSETIREYIGAVERFARYFGKPPDQLGPDHIRQYQAHLLHERKLAVGTVVAQTAGLRFFFVRTLKRRFPPDSIPYPKYTKHRVPQVLSPEEVAQLIDAASNLQARAILVTLYSTGMRRSELVRLRGGHRQQAHDCSHSQGQGWQRSRCASVPKTAGDTPRVLALEETQDMALPPWDC
jgi:integrase/recombinase XerD